MKWVIGKCLAFAGARTHSTIAALSSHVPTLSLSYSIKAIGINKDIFGHQDFCHPVRTINPAQFADIMERIVTDGAAIRAHLDVRIPEVQARARVAGHILRDQIGG
jgi:colanic acid/amylovoran biosynthesis protein